MEKKKVTRKQYNDLVKAEILRLKEEEKKHKKNNKNVINKDRAYKSIGTLGGG